MADVACECTKTWHCIKEVLSVSVIFTGTICKPGVTKLVIGQSLCFALMFPLNEGFLLYQIILKFH